MTSERRTGGFGETLDLLEEAKQGDKSALERLLARYNDHILEIVRIRLGRSLRRVVESRDILQEAMIDAFLGFDQYEIREDASFVNWLARIVEHRICRKAEYHGAQKRDERRRVSLEAKLGATDPMNDSDADPADPRPSVPDQMAHAEECDGVADCVAELPEKYRNVIAMRDYVGAEWAEVARETGHSTANAARMTHARACAELGILMRARGIV